MNRLSSEDLAAAKDACETALADARESGALLNVMNSSMRMTKQKKFVHWDKAVPAFMRKSDDVVRGKIERSLLGGAGIWSTGQGDAYDDDEDISKLKTSAYARAIKAQAELPTYSIESVHF